MPRSSPRHFLSRRKSPRAWSFSHWTSASALRRSAKGYSSRADRGNAPLGGVGHPKQLRRGIAVLQACKVAPLRDAETEDLEDRLGRAERADDAMARIGGVGHEHRRQKNALGQRAFRIEEHV